MVRLTTGGFELGTASAASGFEFDQIGGTPSITSGTVLSGSFAGDITGMSSGARQGFTYRFSNATTTLGIFVRAYYNFATFPSAENRIMAFNLGASIASTNAAYMTIDNNRQPRVYYDGGNIGGAGPSLVTGSFHRFELHLDKSPGAAAGLINSFVGATLVGSAANLTITNAYNSLSFGGNLNAETQTTGNWFIDDYGINDSTGANQNTFLGEGHVMNIWPAGSGAAASFIQQSTAASKNWQFVGTIFDQPVPDTSSSFIGATVAQTIDDWALSPTPASIQSGDTINVVSVSMMMAGGQGGNGNTQIRARIFASIGVGGTNTEGATYTPTGSNWFMNGFAVSTQINRNPMLTTYVVPGVGSSTMWTKGFLDQAAAGVRVSSAGPTGATMISTAFITVDWTPVAAAAASPGQQFQQIMMMDVGR